MPAVVEKPRAAAKSRRGRGAFDQLDILDAERSSGEGAQEADGVVSGPWDRQEDHGRDDLARFLTADYSVHFVADVTELETTVREGQKQLFIYDDFLTRTNLGDAPGATDQERLFILMRYLNRTPSKYLILLRARICTVNRIPRMSVLRPIEPMFSDASWTSTVIFQSIVL